MDDELSKAVAVTIASPSGLGAPGMYRSPPLAICPIESCAWTFEENAPTRGEERFFDSSAELFAEIAKRADDLIRQHLETHTLLEWVQEVTRLRSELEDERRG